MAWSQKGEIMKQPEQLTAEQRLRLYQQRAARLKAAQSSDQFLTQQQRAREQLKRLQSLMSDTRSSN